MQTLQQTTKQILVVEDEGLIADDIRRRLERLGYAVPAIASSGEEALRLARSLPCDLALMDIRLKGEMDGIAVARTLKDELRLPVVYLTAHADVDTVNRATLTEPFGYVLKPIADANLRTTIQIALYKHEMERRLRVSEAWLSTTLRSIGDAIIAADPDGLIIFMNTAAVTLTGWTAANAEGRPLMEVLNLRDQSGEPVCNPVIDLLPDETRAYNLVSPDRRCTAVEVACFDNRDDVDLLGAIVVFRDIRARQESDSRNIQSQRMDAITTLAEQIASRNLAAPELCTRLASLGRPITTTHRVIDVNEAIAEIHQSPCLCVPSRIRLQTDLNPNTGFIRAERARFQDMVIGLARRAAAAVQSDGVVRISTSILDFNPGDLMARRYGQTWLVRLEISSDGPLVDDRNPVAIFEPVLSPDAGEGLFDAAIAHNVIVQAGGHITVRSGPTGLSFEILWPCIGTHEDALEMMRHFPDPAPSILVVEEEDALRRQICTCLEREGYRFLETKTIQHASEIVPIHGFRIDAAILPAGAEPFAAHLDVPALYLAGYVHDSVPAANVLPKPFPVLELRRRLMQMLPQFAEALRNSQ
jgi:two-component system, cell cycle sensor histidine kinase and response regulator CckA